MIELLISSSLLIIIVTLLRVVLKGRISPRLQYGLWALVLLRLLIPLNFLQSSISVMNSASELPPVVALNTVKDFEQLEFHDGSVVGYSKGDYSREYPSLIAEDKTERDFAHMQAALSAKDVLPRVWLGGAVLFALFMAVCNLRFAQRLKCTRKPLNSDAFKASHPALRACPLPVYAASGLPSPCLYGVFRPAIYLTPDSLTDAEALRHTLAHELTHFRHGDNLWCALRVLCLCVYWFDPLVWLAATLSKRDAELACDEGAIAALGEEQRAAYGRTLIRLSCARPRPTDLFCAATTMTGSKHSIKERVTLIAKKPKMLFTTLFAALLIVAVAVGCTFTGSVAEDAVAPEGAFVTPAPLPSPAPDTEADSTSYEAQREYLPVRVTEAAENAVSQWFASDRTDFADGELSSWRINYLTKVYSYSTQLYFDDGPALDVYRMNYEYLSEAPENLTLSDGMYKKDDGWVCLTYPDSSYIIYCPDYDLCLLTMAQSDCQPGDAVFTSDMNLLLDQRGYRIVAQPALTIDEVIATIDGINWQDYSREHGSGETVDNISSISHLVYYASYFVIDSDQMQVLLTSTDGLDGAYADAYAALIANLYSFHSDIFVNTFKVLPEEDKATVYGLLDYAAPELDKSDLGYTVVTAQP